MQEDVGEVFADLATNGKCFEVLCCLGNLEFGHRVQGRTHKVQRMDKRDRKFCLVNKGTGGNEEADSISSKKGSS